LSNVVGLCCPAAVLMEDGRQNNFGTIFCPVSLKFLFEKIAMIVILMNLILMILMVLVLMILIFLFD
jgi:hypothetical protein